MRPSAQRASTPLRNRLLRASLLCLAIYLLACVGCASFQRRLIYFPPVFSAQEVERLARAEGLQPWQSSDGKRIGWKRPSPVQPSLGQVLITHGNASCAFQCSHYAEAIQQAGAFDVFMVEYPGYADRPGAPSETSLDQAASEAFQLLDTNRPIYLVGESLGTGVAAYLAGLHPEQVSGLVLLAPYTCLADVAQAHVWILPVHLLLCDRFPAEEDLRRYHGPTAILVGGRDKVVPERFGRDLYNSYAGPKRLWSFPESSHDGLMFQPPGIWKEIFSFLQTRRAAQK